MQAAQAIVPDVPIRSREDVRLVIHGVRWGRYVAIRELLDEHAGLRMTYLEGTLEIMSPSPEHEREKKLIARLIEAWALAKRVRLNGYGSATFRREAKERGAEPDECYVLGSALKDVPDIAIEIVLTSGGVDKLAVYQGLEVPEVWFYQAGSFALYRLGATSYAPIARSVLLPELDLAILASFVSYEDQTEALLAYLETVR